MQALPPQLPSQKTRFRQTGPPPIGALSRVKAELRVNGAVAYDLWLPETYYLPHIIHDDEHIMGTVYGRYKGGRGVLIATTERILFLDKKPGWLRCDEVTFPMIHGVTRTRIGPIGNVTLHTKQGDYALRTFNQKNAENFVGYVELRCLQNTTRAV